jgi:hypothetical protein
MTLSKLPNFKGENKLLYRYSEHKILGQNFRKRVFNQGPTLILVMTDNGYVFGGYTPIPWTEGKDRQWIPT